ncbi:hypothetical protein Tco_0482034 [Tanacetum coccineum]
MRPIYSAKLKLLGPLALLSKPSISAIHFFNHLIYVGGCDDDDGGMGRWSIAVDESGRVVMEMVSCRVVAWQRRGSGDSDHNFHKTSILVGGGGGGVAESEYGDRDCPDYEASRARGFVHRSLEFQS